MEGDAYEEILAVRMDLENVNDNLSRYHCLFRMNDYSVRLIIPVYDWSGSGWNAATEFQMRHQIYPESTIFTVTPYTITGSVQSGSFFDYFEEEVSPW